MPLRLTGAVLAALCLTAAHPAFGQGASALDVTRAVRASWYDCAKPGQCSRSKRTASGERFDPNALTCAHRTYRFGTRLRVTYRGRSVVCRVNDRGPFIKGRSLDVSRACARAISLRGVAVVTIERI